MYQGAQFEGFDLMPPTILNKRRYICFFSRVELSLKMNDSHKLMTPLGFHPEIHPVMGDPGASWLLLLLYHPPRAAGQKTWQWREMAEIKQEKAKWGLTWHRAPLWQFNRKAVLDGASDELHSLPVCLSLCKCHRQSGNARLLCFSGCLVSCSRKKGGISINTEPMSITHVTWQHLLTDKGNLTVVMCYPARDDV